MTNNDNIQMTVADLITRLQTLDPNMPIRMSMNGEYECGVTADMVFTYDGSLMIDSEGDYDYGFSNKGN